MKNGPISNIPRDPRTPLLDGSKIGPTLDIHDMLGQILIPVLTDFMLLVSNPHVGLNLIGGCGGVINMSPRIGAIYSTEGTLTFETNIKRDV